MRRAARARRGFVLDSHAVERRDGAREKGASAAHDVVARIDVLPIALRGVERKLVEDAAALKARHPIAYADAFAAATARRLGLPVVTGDPEFGCLEQVVEVVWTSGPGT